MTRERVDRYVKRSGELFKKRGFWTNAAAYQAAICFTLCACVSGSLLAVETTKKGRIFMAPKFAGDPDSFTYISAMIFIVRYSS
jgi:hypothetical protein